TQGQPQQGQPQQGQPQQGQPQQGQPQQGQPQQGQPQRGQPPSLTGLLGGFAKLLTWFYWVAVIVIIAVVLWRFRDQWSAYFRHLLAQFQAFLSWLRGEKEEPSEVGGDGVRPDTAPKQATFADFSNPFQRKDAGGRDAAELLRYTFAALEAWGHDRGWGRATEQTPLEFAQAIGRRDPALAACSREVCDAYCRLAYGDRRLPTSIAEPMAALWSCMTARRHADRPNGEADRGLAQSSSGGRAP
ncbi:MAG: DUF4129 domain-containing protein, partial [Planctomycetes bacterium]|nr:DUF4129 domain-containing protein [Planctomycetota bacterium]